LPMLRMYPVGVVEPAGRLELLMTGDWPSVPI
jgi:hypothetical protein